MRQKSIRLVYLVTLSKYITFLFVQIYIPIDIGQIKIFVIWDKMFIA